MSQQVIKLVVRGSLLGAVQTRMAFYYGRDASTVEDADIQVCVDAIETMLHDACPILTNETLFYACDAYVLDKEGHYVKRPGAIWSLHGADTNNDMTAFQISALIEAGCQVWRARGKKFLPGISEYFTLAGSLSIDALLYLIQVAFDYIAPVYDINTGHEWFPGVPSKRAVFAPFVNGAVGSVLSTIRRRKPGYGI